MPKGGKEFAANMGFFFSRYTLPDSADDDAVNEKCKYSVPNIIFTKGNHAGN